MLRLIFLLVAVTCMYYSSSAEASMLDPCRLIKCDKPFVPCLEAIANTGSYGCRCVKSCRSSNIIRAPIVRTLAPLFYKTNRPSYLSNILDSSAAGGLVGSKTTQSTPSGGSFVNSSQLVPIAKQGGSSCYPSACMNGGTCYSYVTPVTTTTTTTTHVYNNPLCSCQPQFSGSRCELYSTSYDTSSSYPSYSSSSSYNTGWNNLCRVYNDRNMNICQNGGQCVFISDGKVACVCPSSFAGQYCEYSIYAQCTGPAYSQCHRSQGTCLNDGTCQCNQGYTGTRCDQVTNSQPTSGTGYCLNGGSCVSISVSPFLACQCLPQFTGTRCEFNVNSTSSNTTTSSSITTTTTLASTTGTYQPRCNISITMLNQGAYTARMRIIYYIDGIQQPVYISRNLPLLGDGAIHTIPYYSTNITVLGEKLFGDWYSIFSDTGLNTTSTCTKCYKVWGAIATTSWDYYTC